MGTSLAAPLWAGTLADINQYLVAQGQPRAGFITPTLYALYNAYQQHQVSYMPFNDVSTGQGNDAYQERPGWDEVTGLGTPDAWNLAQDLKSWPALTASYAPSGQPSAFTACGSVTYQVQVTNTGRSTWPANGPNPVHLGIHFFQPGSSWATDQRYPLIQDLPPGWTQTLTVTVTPPATGGSHTLEYQMVQEGITWFSQTLDSSVTVNAPSLGACYTPASQPMQFGSGATATFNVTVRNAGSSTWPSGGSNPVHLDIAFANQGGGWGVSGTESTWATYRRYNLPSNVAPGQSVTLSVPVTAPSTAGTYVLEYQMVQESVAWFPEYLDSSVSVGDGNGASYMPSGAPSNFASGASASYRVTVTNTGTTTWNAGGTNPYHLGIHFAPINGSGWATDQRFSLPYNIAPGQSVTLTVTVTAPTTTGGYYLEYEMVQENLEWFAQKRDDTVTVGQLAYSALVYPQGQPSSFTAGGEVKMQARLVNTGTSTWSAGGSNPIHLGVHFAAGTGGYPSSLPWSTDQRIDLPYDVPPNQGVTLTFIVMVPPAAGTYNLEYQMVHEGIAWFGQVVDSSVTVS